MHPPADKGFRPSLPEMPEGERQALLRMFCTLTWRDLANLALALAQDETSVVRRLAHRIKGAASSIGAAEMAEAAEWLELHAADGGRGARDQALRTLIASFRAVKAYVEQFEGDDPDGPGAPPP